MASEDIWIILIAILGGTSCALLGSFLVLRRMAMLGDAISHAILPGIVAAFLFSGSRALLPMFIGAAIFGLGTAWISDLLHRQGKLQEDASIGVTFTWLFALGVIFISAYAGQVDLDQECVLYGEIAFAPLDTIVLAGFDVPRTFASLGIVCLLSLVFVISCYHRLKITSFDKGLAEAMGIRSGVWHYLLMALVSIVTVAAFEAVGAILVVAMLVVPANIGFLLATSLSGMLITAVAVASVSSIGGYYLASYYDGSISAGIVIVAGAFLAAVIVTQLLLKLCNTAGGVPESHAR